MDSSRSLVLHEVIGMTESELMSYAKEEGLLVRITARDNVLYFGTMDVRMDRINVSIVDGKITSAKFG